MALCLPPVRSPLHARITKYPTLFLAQEADSLGHQLEIIRADAAGLQAELDTRTEECKAHVQAQEAKVAACAALEEKVESLQALVEKKVLSPLPIPFATYLHTPSLFFRISSFSI